MENERQLVLFLRGNVAFNPTQMAAKINQKFTELGNPAIFPPNPKETENQPLILFQQGTVQLTINYHDVSFIYLEENHEESLELIIRLTDYLIDEFSLDFTRMGYISTYHHGKKERDHFKKKMFASTDLIKDDFQLSWYTKKTIDSVLVNVWQRYFTDIRQHLDMVSIFDINTPVEEEYNITSDFLDTFLKKCDKFIEGELKDRL